MGVLLNPKHERFAQLLAAGSMAKDAIVQAGYKFSDAQVWQLKKKTAARVREIQEEGSRMVSLSVLADRNRVISRLDKLGRAAEADKRWGDAIRAEELIGRSLGMFNDKNPSDLPWDGDLSTLSDRALETAINHFLAIAYPDPNEREQVRRKALEAEGVVEATFEDVTDKPPDTDW